MFVDHLHHTSGSVLSVRYQVSNIYSGADDSSVCPEVASRAERIVDKSLEALHGLLPHWPIASRWLEALRKIACPMQVESRAIDSIESVSKIFADLCDSCY